MADDRVRIDCLSTGVPGLDAVLGGGIPKLSFNVISGSPGTGKTTLALQIAFANATVERPAICFTGLGEPSVKLLRYQQQFTFFDPRRIGVDVYVQTLADAILAGEGDMRPVLDHIAAEVAALKPGIVVIDSFRALLPPACPPLGPEGMGIERFMHVLAHQLTTWEVTAFLIGEYAQAEQSSPLFTMADGLILLAQHVERNAAQRTVQALKQRGVPVVAGAHNLRITADGLHVYPRLVADRSRIRRLPAPRISTGVAALDEMFGGGIPAGDAILVTGQSGVGKTSVGLEFLHAADQRGDAAAVVLFEEDPQSLLNRAAAQGKDLAAMHDRGRLTFVPLGPLDLSVDEILHAIADAVARVGARLVVIDSLTGLELALAPSFRDDFREAIYRLVRSVTATGITVLMTMEIVEPASASRTASRQLSFLADDILVLRYLELRGEMRKVLHVMKMRRSRHSPLLREYELTRHGVKIGGTLREYDNILARSPDRRVGTLPGAPSGLSEPEAEILERLIRGDEMSAQELADALAMPVDFVRAALLRMAELGLARRTEETPLPAPDDVTYRALAQPAPR